MQSSRRRVLLGLGLVGAAVVLAVAVQVSTPDVPDVADGAIPTTTAGSLRGLPDRDPRVADPDSGEVAVPSSVLSEHTTKASGTKSSKKHKATTTTRKPKRTTTTRSARSRSLFAAILKGATTTTAPRSSSVGAVPTPATPATPATTPATTSPPPTTTPPPTTSPPATTPPTTDPPVTTPPTTDPPPTAPPTTDPPPTTSPPQVVAQNPLLTILELLGLPVGP